MFRIEVAQRMAPVPQDAAILAPSPLSQTRRLLYDPVDVGYVRRHAGPEGTPALATLGSGDGALVLLRFSIDLPPEPHIVAAFADGLARPRHQPDW